MSSIDTHSGGQHATAEVVIAEVVARQIEAMILDGRLGAGERLPAERTLCRSLKVSRNTLREALKDLRGRGVIQTRRGSGTFVAGLQMLQVQPSTALQNLLQNHPQTLAGLIEVRRLLEGEAAYQAARRAGDEDLQALQRAYREVVAPPSPGDSSAARAQRDIRFHRAIYSAAHNPILLLALNAIRDLMMSFIFDTTDRLYTRPGAWRQLRTQHRRIYRAIEKRDAPAARRAAGAHIDAVAEALNRRPEH